MLCIKALHYTVWHRIFNLEWRDQHTVTLHYSTVPERMSDTCLPGFQLSQALKQTISLLFLLFRMLGSLASIIPERKNAHHSIRQSLDSHDNVEVEAAIFAAASFSAQSK